MSADNSYDSLSSSERAEAAAEAEESLAAASVRKVYRLINDNLQSVGGIEVCAGFCGVDRGDLRKAIDRGTPTQPRYLAVDHVIRILGRMRKHNAGKATELGALLVRSGDLMV